MNRKMQQVSKDRHPKFKDWGCRKQFRSLSTTKVERFENQDQFPEFHLVLGMIGTLAQHCQHKANETCSFTTFRLYITLKSHHNTVLHGPFLEPQLRVDSQPGRYFKGPKERGSTKSYQLKCRMFILRSWLLPSSLYKMWICQHPVEVSHTST